MGRGVTRRDFLEESLAAATAALAAAAGPAIGAAPRRSAVPARGRRRFGAGDTVHIACVGLHSRGMAHVAGYSGIPGVRIAALCDVDGSVAARAAEAVVKAGQPAPKVYQDLRKLFEDPEIDAVSLAMPIHWHALASIWAMQAGKDVYCEKPVSHNVTEGRRSAQAAVRYGRICQAGTQSRSHRACQQAMAAIHGGAIGPVRLARGLCYKRRTSIGIKPDGPVPEGVDYDLWLGPAPKRPFNPNRFHYNWHWNWDYGTGDLGNQGIHQMDLARWALGAEELPRAVMAVGGRFGYVDQGETPNTMVTWFDYGDRHLIFEVRGLPTPPYEGVGIGNIVYGDSGYVAITDNYGRAVRMTNDHQPVETYSGGGNHFANFIESVRAQRSAHLNAPVAGAHLSSALCHLGNASYRLGRAAPFDLPHRPFNDREADAAFARMKEHLASNGVDVGRTPDFIGRPLRVDPQTERFLESEANRFLTRDYREPFVVPAHV